MKTSTRLILLLTLLVGAIMAAGGYYRLRQRELVLRNAMRTEVHVQVTTLGYSLEFIYRTQRSQEAQQLVAGLNRDPKIYSVTLFDEAGRVLSGSNPVTGNAMTQLQRDAMRVLEARRPSELVRRVNGEDVFSIVTPIRTGKERWGALEVGQSMSFINAEIVRARWDIAIVTLLLFGAILSSVLAVMRYSLMRPINELLRGAVALGRGDLSYRVNMPRQSNELAQLANEFNRMADGLADQQKQAVREAEKRLELERELRHNEWLAALGRLAAGVAHELGTPLNVMDARAEQLIERPDAPLEIRQRNLAIIRANIDRIIRIVRQLLNLARPYQLDRRPVLASRLLSVVVESLEAQAGRFGVEVEMSVDKEALFDVDQDLIHQVLLNIGQNALQATPSGGLVCIECGSEIVSKNGFSFVAVHVTDTGGGIAPEHLPHIFEPFFTTKDIGSGTGLGLAVSRRIIEEHSGWVTAANQAGGGAVFTVFLPVAGAAAATIRPAKAYAI
ncbi:MAG: ATP-binding protein [Blastocatellia bacterium]